MFVKLALADKPDDKMQVIKEYFSKLEARLLVFIDNADTMTKEEKKWLNSCKCRMIITSRQKIDGFYGVNINSPSPAYCKEMYIRESRGNNFDGYSLDEDRYIEKITELANYHTQTVMLIAKAQYCLGLSSEEMLDELNNTGFVLKGNDEIIDTEEYELTMAEHLTKIFNLLNVTDETQLKTIRLFSLLAPNTPVKKRDIKKWFELKSLSSINELVKYGWLNSSGSEYVSIHPVIADVVKYNNKPDFEFALPLINALQEEMKVADDYIKKNAVIVHAVAVNKTIGDYNSEKYAFFLLNIADVYENLGSYNDSISYYLRAISIIKCLFGNDHPKTALFYTPISLYYSKICDYNSAIEFQKKALLIQEKNLGKEHPDTLLSYTIIALIYYEKGDYDNALKLNNNILSIQEKVLGIDSIDIAKTYNNIGLCYYKKDDYSKALEYHKKAISIYEKNMVFTHVDIATSYMGMGNISYKCDDYNNALEYYYKALKIYESIFGSDRINMTSVYEPIGMLHYIKGEIDLSLNFYKKAHIIKEKVLGPDHPDTIEIQKRIDKIQNLLLDI